LGTEDRETGDLGPEHGPGVQKNRGDTLSGELSGKVVVVPVAWAAAGALAMQLAVRGATIVLVGPDADMAGRLAGAIQTATGGEGAGRPAVFVADDSRHSIEALGNFLAEMFRAPSPQSR